VEGVKGKCLEVDGIAKHYHLPKGIIHTLEEVTFHVHEREFVSIVGPSGCGKSTLLKIIAGLDKPTKGQVRLKGEVVDRPHPKISMVFQSFALFPWRTVLQNIELGLETRGVPKNVRRKVAERLAETVGLKGCEHCYPRELSGGMKQRVSMARALAIDPEVVLLDEAFSAVDEFTAQVLRSEVIELWEETEKTFILVTHNLAEAIEMADKILVLTSRPAKLKHMVNVNLKRPRSRHRPEFVRIQRELFELLREELEKTIIRHKLKNIYRQKKIEDIER
jgi:NitT/TauT family transport system ATP-binding protein